MNKKSSIAIFLAATSTLAISSAAHQNLKASAKAKLIAGEALTAEEADTIVL